MIVVVSILAGVLFLGYLFVASERDHWRQKAEGYERIMDQLMPQINEFKKILNDDMDRKVERLKKMQELSWEQVTFEETRKN